MSTLPSVAATKLPWRRVSRWKAQGPAMWSGVTGTSRPRQEAGEDRLLGMEAVLRLVKDDRVRAVHRAVADLEAAVRREAVHDEDVRAGEADQGLVEGEPAERLHPRLLLLLHPHGDPHVRVEDVRALRRLAGVVGDVDAAPVAFRGLPGQGGHVAVRLEPLGRRDRHRHPGHGTAEEDGGGDIVPVPDVGEPKALELPPALQDRQEVGDELARVLAVIEAVDHGDAGPLREFDHVLMPEGAEHDAVHIPGEDARGVRDGLAAAQLRVLGVEVHGVPAELGHADLEGDARPRRGLLKDHPQRPAAQGLVRLPRLQAALHRQGELEEPDEVLLDVEHGDEVALRHGRACPGSVKKVPLGKEPLALREDQGEGHEGQEGPGEQGAEDEDPRHGACGGDAPSVAQIALVGSVHTEQRGHPGAARAVHGGGCRWRRRGDRLLQGSACPAAEPGGVPALPAAPAELPVGPGTAGRRRSLGEPATRAVQGPVVHRTAAARARGHARQPGTGVKYLPPVGTGRVRGVARGAVSGQAGPPPTKDRAPGRRGRASPLSRCRGGRRPRPTGAAPGPGGGDGRWTGPLGGGVPPPPVGEAQSSSIPRRSDGRGRDRVAWFILRDCGSLDPSSKGARDPARRKFSVPAPRTTALSLTRPAGILRAGTGRQDGPSPVPVAPVTAMIKQAEGEVKPLDLEARVRDYWARTKSYSRTKKHRASGKEFYFCDGPPYTTGSIHLGTAMNKVVKDTVVRYTRMHDRNVRDQPGWDMHGLPIEVQVEKLLGIANKKEIESLGIEKFVERCRAHAQELRGRMTEQFIGLGVWMDWEHPYMTITNTYMEAAWWTLKRAHERGYLVEAHRSVNWCPRCETALAEAEIEYEDVDDPSVFVKFPLRGRPHESLLVWTTTPWTLPANLAVAVHPQYEYGKVRVVREGKAEFLWVLMERVPDLMKEAGVTEYEVVDTAVGHSMLGWEYEHPFREQVPHQASVQGQWIHKVLGAETVAKEDPGLVHIAPGHGPDDFEIGLRHGIAAFCPVDERGRYTDEAGTYAGKAIREANPEIVGFLQDRGLLFRHTTARHRYGHRWRCRTPLLFRTTRQWFVKVSELKDTMVREIQRVRWTPDWAGAARQMEWTQNLRDWCVSRQRYWGTPLPVWRCESCREIKVVGSTRELAEGKNYVAGMDFHRPWIDQVTFGCP